MNITDKQFEFAKENVNLISCRSMAKMLGTTYDILRYQCLKRNITFSKYKNNGNINLFYNIDKPQIAYLLGFLWADGYIKNNQSSIEMSILYNDALQVKNVIDGMIRYRQYKRKRKGKRITLTLTINDILLVNLLKSQFDFHNKNYHFFNLSTIPTDLYKYFLRGYLDGDGHIAQTKVSFSSSFDYNWGNFILLLKDIGITEYKIRKYISKENYKSSTMIINLKNNSRKLLEFIYNGDTHIGLQRKYNLFKKYYL
jgi:hypothetical protein